MAHASPFARLNQENPTKPSASSESRVARDDVLEQAAKECDALGRMAPNQERGLGYDIAAKCIRELKRPQAAPLGDNPSLRSAVAVNEQAMNLSHKFGCMVTAALQQDWEEVAALARSVTITMRDGEPAIAALDKLAASVPSSEREIIPPIIHNDHEWPRLCADVTGMSAIRWKAADGNYRWMLHAEAISARQCVSSAIRGKTDCTEPDRARCPRGCRDFCNEAEERKASGR